MSLKSLVNKSIIKSDLRRFWYLGALFAAGLILFTALPIGIYPNPLYVSESETFLDSYFSSEVWISIVPIFVFSILIPAMIFSYLHHKRSVCAIHSLPLKRSTLYVSHLISIALIILAAVTVNTFTLITICRVPVSFVLIWAGLTIVYCFIMSSFSAMASILVGNTAAGIILPVIITALPIFVVQITITLCRTNLYGYTSPSGLSKFISIVYLTYESMLKGWLLLYIALGIIFLCLGAAAYKKRALENHSRIVSFNFLNPIFLYSFALCLGFLGYYYIAQIISLTQSFWIAVPFGIIGVIIAKMIINKSLKPKGIIIPIAAYCLMMVIIYLFVGADITGYEKRLPNSEDVASIVIDNNYFTHTSDRTTVKDDITIAPAKSTIIDTTIRDKKDIEKVIALHSAVSDGGKEDRFKLHIYIDYTLTNGKHLQRAYSFAISTELYKLYGEVMDIKNLKESRFPVLTDVGLSYEWGSARTMSTNQKSFDYERTKLLVQALKTDIENSRFADYSYKETLTTVSINHRRPSVNYDTGALIADKKLWIEEWTEYNIYSGYTNTIKLLKDWGMYHDMPTAEDIKQIEYYNEKFENADTITDKAEIAKILDYLENNEEKALSHSRNSLHTYYISYTDDTMYSIQTDDKLH